MTDPRDVLDAIQQRADAATPAPWITFDTSSSDPDLNDGLPHILMPEYMRAMHAWNEIGYVSEDCPADAHFIAHARADIPHLVAALRAVLDLAADADSTATQILTYGVPSGQVSTVELRRRIAEALGGVE